MKKISKVLAAMAILGTSATASAWWGGPFNGLGNGFGNGSGDFNFGFSARSNVAARGYGNGNGYGYNAPYYGYAPYGYAPYGYAPPAPAPVMSEEQRKSMIDAQAAAAKQAQTAYTQQLEAYRKAFKNPPARSGFGYANMADRFAAPAQMMQEMRQREAKILKEMEERRLEMEKKFADSRKQSQARHAAMIREIEQRHTNINHI